MNTLDEVDKIESMFSLLGDFLDKSWDELEKERKEQEKSKEIKINEKEKRRQKVVEKLIMKGIKIRDEITNNIKLLRNLIKQNRYDNALSLIITIKGQLNIDPILRKDEEHGTLWAIYPDEIEKIKKELDFLRMELYKSKKAN